MTDSFISLKHCSKCSKNYIGRPAISRVDNNTLICPDCGTREALESIGISPEEQEKNPVDNKNYKCTHLIEIK